MGLDWKLSKANERWKLQFNEKTMSCLTVKGLYSRMRVRESERRGKKEKKRKEKGRERKIKECESRKEERQR